MPAKMGRLKVGATPREYRSVGLVIQGRAKAAPPIGERMVTRLRETVEAVPEGSRPPS